MSKILIIDDDPAALELLKALFQKKDYDVELATDGQMGLEKITDDVDVVLCDIMMPGLNGYQFIQKVKKDMDRADLPVIFMSSLTDQKSVVKGFDLQADDYITKPFRTEELFARVARTLAKSQKTDDLNVIISGELEERDLVEILRFCEEHRISGQIVLTHDDQEGTIDLELGEIVQIKREDVTGEEALDELLTWQTGSYKVVQKELKTCDPTAEEKEDAQSEKTKILIVDSDIELLEKLWSFLNEDHNVIKTKSTEEAFTILELQGKDWSDILLVDIDSFGEESLELIIDAKKENPNLQIIGITSTKTPSIRETLLLDSPMIFLEKPITDDRLTDALSQAINIQCTISETEEQYLELIDLIHLLTIVKSTACLDIEKTPSETGEIYIENGKITRANYQEQSDIDAFKTIINWENGSFSIKLGETPEEKALDSFWWELVSETPEAETEAEIIDKETLTIIQEKLTKLKREIAEIESFGIITRDGKLLYSIFEDESICKEICPIMTEIVSTSEELCDLQNKGEWSEISIIGEKGDIHIWPITDRFILLLTTAFDTNWAMLNMYCQEVSEEIAILLKS